MQADGIVDDDARDGQARDARKAAGAPRNLVPLQQDGVHDVVEAQGGHGQVVARETQDGNADHHGHETNQDGHQGHGRPGRQAEGHRGHGRAIGAHAEEGGMAEGDLPRVADEKIEAQDHDGVDGDEVGQAQGVGVVLHERENQQHRGQERHSQPCAVQGEEVEESSVCRSCISLSRRR